MLKHKDLLPFPIILILSPTPCGTSYTIIKEVANEQLTVFEGNSFIFVGHLSNKSGNIALCSGYESVDCSTGMEWNGGIEYCNDL